MTTLQEIPSISQNIEAAPFKNIKSLYKFLFEAEGNKACRRIVRQFSGFPFDCESDEYKTKIEYVNTNLTFVEMQAIAKILGIEDGPTTEDLARRACITLMNLDSLKEEEEEDDDSEEEDEDEEDLEKVHKDVKDEIQDKMSAATSRLSIKTPPPVMSASYRDIEDSIRTFNGTDSYPVERWIADFEDLAQLVNLSDLQMVLFARKSITGLAKLFIQGERNLNTWTKFKDALKREFTSRMSSAQLHQTLARRRQKKEESTQEYFLAMKEISNQGEIETEALIQYVIDGLYDEPGNKTVLYGATNVEEFKKKLRIYDEIRKKIESKSAYKKERNNKFDNKKKEMKGQRCYNCGDSDHKASECKSKALGSKCFRCNQFGHISTKCPKKQNKSELKVAETSKKPVLLEKKTNTNGVYKEVDINGHKINALIDTGCSVNLIKSSQYLMLKEKPLDDIKIRLNGIGTNEVNTLGRFETNLKICDVESDITIHVVPDDMMPPPMVIGKRFLDDYEINIVGGNVESMKKIRHEEENREQEDFMHISIEEPKIDVKNPTCGTKMGELVNENLPSEDPTKTVTSEEVISKLEAQKAIFGNPRQIISDRGTAFTSNLFKEYCEQEKIDLLHITTGVPRGNGQVERVNRSIIPVLTKLSKNEEDKWYKFVPQLQSALNNTYQRSISCTPAKLFFGVNMRRAEDLELTKLIEDEYLATYQEEREQDRMKAREQIKKIQAENKKTFNKRRKMPNKYNEGDIVAIKRTQFVNQSKLKCNFLGPYKVTKVKRNDRYDVEKLGPGEGPRQTSTSAEYMKPWYTPDDDTEYEEFHEPYRDDVLSEEIPRAEPPSGMAEL